MERLNDLTNRELDRYYLDSEVALEALKERLLSLQDERFRRYRTIRMLGETAGDWRGGTLAGMTHDPHYPDVLFEPDASNLSFLPSSVSPEPSEGLERQVDAVGA